MIPVDTNYKTMLSLTSQSTSFQGYFSIPLSPCPIVDSVNGVFKNRLPFLCEEYMCTLNNFCFVTYHCFANIKFFIDIWNT